jgi:hypothetical protein
VDVAFRVATQILKLQLGGTLRVVSQSLGRCVQERVVPGPVKLAQLPHKVIFGQVRRGYTQLLRGGLQWLF